MLDVLEKKIYNPERTRQEVFFDLDMNSIIDLHSYGHDIETSWLADRTLEVLGDDELTARITKITSALAECIYNTAYTGSCVLNENERGKDDTTRVWWVQNESVIGFVKNQYPNTEKSFKHIKFPVFDDVDVDVHTTPLRLYHPNHKRELKKWIHQQKDKQFAHVISLSSNGVNVSVPTARFNVVYQMGHILIHLLDEGIGLRHMIDYYYVLRTIGSLSDTEKSVIAEEWRRFGMLRLATGVMWIEKEILGLPEDFLIVEPNAKRGNMLLDKMLEGGNFGHHSPVHRLRDKYFSFRFAKAMHHGAYYRTTMKIRKGFKYLALLTHR